MLARMSIRTSPGRGTHEPAWATPESVLDPGLTLPATTPEAPWRTRVRATLWWHRATPEAVLALPAELRDQTGVALTVGATITYEQSPVGPYEEVLAVPCLLHPSLPDLLSVHVPFIAVDSLASIAGGRQHWALPKAYATMERAGDRVIATGDGWRVAADPTPAGPRVPLVGAFRDVQLGARGLMSARSRLRGTGRYARVNVAVTSSTAGEPGSIGGWLRPGHHPGLVLRGRLTVGAPTMSHP